MDRKIDYLHLVYIIIIFVVVLLAIWLSSPYIVCEESLAKFEFAATITSIILALISIFYTLFSGLNVSQNLGSMRESSKKIGDVSEKLETIQTSMQEDITHLTGIEMSLQTLLDKQTQTNSLLADLSKNNQILNDTNSNRNFVFDQTSIVGKCIIYACKLSKEHNKPFPANIIGNQAYVHGYVTALETCAPSHFRAQGKQNGLVEVWHFDNDFFKSITKEGISNEIQRNGLYVGMNQVLLNIEQFFAANN